MNRLPLVMAITFFTIDLLSVIYLNICTESIRCASVAHVWNEIHSPIRLFIEPLIFPEVNTHPLSITLLDMFFYDGACILQSTLIGYGTGLLIRNILIPRDRD